jgi:hypothetical protein
MMARVENKTECQTREADLSPSTNVDVPVLKKEVSFSHPRAQLRNREDLMGQQFNASNLCPYCQHALIDWFETLPNVDDDACYDSDHHYPHHSDRSGLQLAVDVHGCRICWLFLSAQRNRYENRRSEYAEYEVVGLTIYCWPGKGDTEWRLRQMSSDAKVIEELSIFFLKMADPAVFAPSRYFGKPTVSEGQIVLSDTEKATNDLSSDYTASLLSAKAWLAECPSSHINCVGLARHRNPTRLLYIKPGYLRLCSGTAIPLSVSYATLSHCWGLMDFFKLTRDNLSAVQKTINIRELSKTFQDAIFIARELGFDYLWIDSLCIIQDDADDWRNEASLMCNVYSHAALNIAAAGAADGSQGCIFERPYPQFWAYPVHLVFQEKVRKFQFADPSTYDRCIRSQPLVRRAWAVQERLLARRTLHFSKTEIFWECKSTIACESFPDGIPRRLFHAEDFKKTRELEWHDVLQYYTAAKLTYGSDKLVALSGIAKTFQQITKDQYLAGMWRSGLESTLCWRVGQIIGPSSWSVGEIIGPSDRPSEERAPSWSWAFVDGQIYIPFARPNAKHYIKVINVSVEPKGEDSFGQVCGGTLELECNAILRGMICGSTKKYTLTEHPVAIGKSMVNLRLYWDCTQYDLLGLHFFIPVDSSSSSSGLNGIVVRPTGNRQGQYRRVGFFEASYALDDESHKILEREMQELNIGGAAEAADFVEIVSDENGRKRYVVEII